MLYCRSLSSTGNLITSSANFEYDNGNSKIATTCINTLKQKYEGRLNHEPMSTEEVQRLLLDQDIPIQIAKELAVIILRDRFSAA